MAKPRLLITGASGFIGSRLGRDLACAWDVVGTCFRCSPGPGLVRLDLGDAGQLERVFREAAPSAVVHAAGMAEPDPCEREPELAFRVNRDAPARLAQLCAQAGLRLICFSTDLVFDGERSWYREEDAARPLSVYGRSKFESEAAVLAACPGAVVLRVATVYGRAWGSRPSFLDTLYTKLSRGEKVLALKDQWRTATPCGQLPEVVGAILRRPELSGVYHWTGATRASRWEFALEFCRVFGFPESGLEPVCMSEMRFCAPRPRDTSLDSGRLSRLLGIAPLSLRAGLERARAQWEPASG